MTSASQSAEAWVIYRSSPEEFSNARPVFALLSGSTSEERVEAILETLYLLEVGRAADALRHSKNRSAPYQANNLGSGFIFCGHGSTTLDAHLVKEVEVAVVEDRGGAELITWRSPTGMLIQGIWSGPKGLLG